MTKFDLVFDVREDKTKVWAAKCLGCGSMIVGERHPPVTVVKFLDDVDPSHFEALKVRVKAAWERARETGNPIVMDRRVVVESVPANDDLQRALEAHEASCTSSITSS